MISITFDKIFDANNTKILVSNVDLLYYVNRTNHLQDHIVERTALPDHLIRSVSGQVAFEEQQPRVGFYKYQYFTDKFTP